MRVDHSVDTRDEQMAAMRAGQMAAWKVLRWVALTADYSVQNLVGWKDEKMVDWKAAETAWHWAGLMVV